MSVAVVRSRALAGMRAPPVEVEVHLANGLPAFNLVGLPETEVREARDRVRAAIQNSQLDFPSSRKITVNLAPADLPKESGRFDLPIAIGLLAAVGLIPFEVLANYEFAGELALTGELRPVRGALAMVLAAKDGGRTFILPQQSALEASLVTDAKVLSATSLLDVLAHLIGKTPLKSPESTTHHVAATYPDLRDVKGQEQAKRALEIAAAGGHSLLFSGPPGTGKSMLAARLPGISPPMSETEALEAAAVMSLTGRFDLSKWAQRPFRSPHRTASAVALVGGGSDPRPGEISLAHCGFLFLDEFPEWDRTVLETLREPMETGWIHISRATRQAEFPARFQLMAAMNPCPCGYSGHPTRSCRCTPDQISRYRGRISGPLLDRIDIAMEVPSIDADTLRSSAQGENSATVRERVVKARNRQLTRQKCANASLATNDIDRYCLVDDAADQLLRRALVSLNLSARAYHRILKVARTIADLSDTDTINARHVAEAVGYRRALEQRN